MDFGIHVQQELFLSEVNHMKRLRFGTTSNDIKEGNRSPIGRANKDIDGKIFVKDTALPF